MKLSGIHHKGEKSLSDFNQEISLNINSEIDNSVQSVSAYKLSTFKNYVYLTVYK